jgi:hypothetical protein
MVDGRGKLGLAQESLSELLVCGQRGGHHLHRDRATKPQVFSEKDLAHPAVTQYRIQAEAGNHGSHT